MMADFFEALLEPEECDFPENQPDFIDEEIEAEYADFPVDDESFLSVEPRWRADYHPAVAQHHASRR